MPLKQWNKLTKIKLLNIHSLLNLISVILTITIMFLSPFGTRNIRHIWSLGWDICCSSDGLQMPWL